MNDLNHQADEAAALVEDAADALAAVAVATEPPSLNDIERRTKLYAEAREDLAKLMSDLEEGIQALQRASLPAIKRAVARASEHHAKLDALLQQRPDLFVKPRTTIWHGIKIGYAKSKDSLDYDAETVLKQIKLRLPLKKDGLIRIKEELVPEAIKLLTPEEKAKVGIRDVPGTDKTVIAPTDSAIEKAVTSLLKAAVDQKIDEQQEGA